MTSLRTLILLSLAVLPTRPARAQGAKPLRKAELVRLLATRALSKPEVAALVRRSCVTFQPTAHDRTELRTAGADDAVLAALDECLRARLARAAPPSPPYPPPAPPARPRAPAPARPSALPPAPLPAVASPPATPIDTPAVVARAEPPPPPPPPPVISERLTQFARGVELHGRVGSTLSQALVLEVRDTAGAPVAGLPVTIVTTSGTVTPSAAESDASGVVRVRVTLGERAGPTVVTARVGTVTRTALVHADPGPPEALVVARGDTPVTGSLTLRSRDTVVLRVVARDRYGNRTTVDAFAATSTGRAIALRSAAADSAAVVVLQPRRSGAGELTLSGSGLRARLAVDVVLPVTSVRPWGIGARTAWLGSNHPWIALAGLTGISGADFSVFGRRTLAAGLSLALGAGASSLNADRPTGAVSLRLLEAYGRAELALVPRATVSPVLSLGAGGYRLKSGDNGQTVYHTNVFWSGGIGVDVEVTPSVIVEVRVERQWMRDTNKGHVATLWPVAAGVRVGL